MKSFLPFIILISLLSLFANCAKTPMTIKETVRVVDTIVVNSIDTLLLKEVVKKEASTFFLVRHAEKEKDTTNPSLTAAGNQRAKELARLLSEVKLSAVYSTNYNRTKETAQPTSIDKNLLINEYNPSEQAAFATEVLAQHPRGKVLIVGHSNTIPALVNIFLGEEVYPSLSDSDYDNLYVLTVYEKGDAEVVVLKYGE